MKKFLCIGSIALLAGCSSINYTKIENSQANITNLQVAETGKVGTDKYQLDVKFDYSIDDYHEISDLYSCSVLFVSSQTQMVTTSQERNPCEINQQSGSISIKWDTPLSKDAGYSTEALKKMSLPLEYHIAIHQKKTSNTNQVIGMSKALYLNPKT